MDNNLVNIDDLVRQRLVGGEERERSGAWLRMRELLDEEEDRKPVGFIWRRMFGGLALLILIGSISLGGYKLAVNAHGSATGKDIASLPDGTGNMTSNNKIATAPSDVKAASQPSRPVAKNGTDRLSASGLQQDDAASASAVAANRQHTDPVDPSLVAATNNTANQHTTHPVEANGNTAQSAAQVTSGDRVALTPQQNRNIDIQAPAGTENSNGVTNNAVPTTTATVVRKQNGNDQSVSSTGVKLTTLHSVAASTGKHSSTNQQNNKMNPATRSKDGIVNDRSPIVSVNKGEAIEKPATGSRAVVDEHPILSAAPSGSIKTPTGIATSETDPKVDVSQVTQNPNGPATAHGAIAEVSGISGHETHRNGIKPKGEKTLQHSPEEKSAVSSSAIAGNRHHLHTNSEMKRDGNTKSPSVSGTRQNSGVALVDRKRSTSSRKLTSGASMSSAQENKTVNKKAGERVASGNNGPVDNTNPSGKTGRSINGQNGTATGKQLNSPKMEGDLSGAMVTSKRNKPNQKSLMNSAVPSTSASSQSGSPVVSGKSVANHADHISGMNILSGTASTATTGNTAAVKGIPTSIGNQATNGIETDKTETASSHMVKKVVQRIMIQQRMMQANPNGVKAHLDTVSIENINEEFSVNDSKGEAATQSKKEGADGDIAANNGSTPLIVPGAAANEDANVAEGKNAAENSKTKAGGHGLGGLQSAFNDIKYSVNNAQFAMGLKGGINGTFFGPNNFKGFQFGVTANFIFSESVNILTELEYFHRINNDYVFNDNYYTYTQLGPNLWSKQQLMNPYSFSTLHSFELPIIFRYTKSKFNFYVGGNLVYSMAINESQGIPTPGVSTSYAGLTPAADTASKIKPSDFNARFGLGYLFGISVQLTPAMSLDIRDVQTFWDNAGTSGSKEVSSQLYRSPSFQLSLGYRFGGRKRKDKE